MGNFIRGHPASPPSSHPSAPSHISGPLHLQSFPPLHSPPSHLPRRPSSLFPYGTSTSDSLVHKGLHNEVEAYHCFLNVVIQSLWHLTAFRLRFVALDYTHVHRSEPCIFCALRSIFSQYEYSESVIIPPDALRQALHDVDLLHGQGRFLLGAQGDAEEALDEILCWLHAEQVQQEHVEKQEDDDVTCVPLCISHTVFGAQYMDLRVCRCGATSDPETSSSSFFYRVYVSDLLAQLHSTLPFSAVLRALYRQQVYSCPTNLDDAAYRCQGPATVDRWMLSQPIVFTLMLAWQLDTTREQIEQVWGALPPSLTLEDFVRVPEGGEGGKGGKQYRLRGLICYYGRHYLAFFEGDGSWLMFDDRRVSVVGDWQVVSDRAVRGKLQPILLFWCQDESKEKLRDSHSLAQTMEPGWHKQRHPHTTPPSIAPRPRPSPAPPRHRPSPPLAAVSAASLQAFGHGEARSKDVDMADVEEEPGAAPARGSRAGSLSGAGVGEMHEDPFFGLESTLTRYATATQIAGTVRR